MTKHTFINFLPRLALAAAPSILNPSFAFGQGDVQEKIIETCIECLDKAPSCQAHPDSGADQISLIICYIEDEAGTRAFLYAANRSRCNYWERIFGARHVEVKLGLRSDGFHKIENAFFDFGDNRSLQVKNINPAGYDSDVSINFPIGDYGPTSGPKSCHWSGVPRPIFTGGN